MNPVRQLAGIWGPVAFAGAAVAAARRAPAYSHRGNHISGLAARRTASAPIMVGGFVAFGTAGLIQIVDDRVVERMVRLAGASTIAAGLAQCSTVDCPVPFVDDGWTASDAAHAAASVAGFTLWTVLPIMAAARPGPRWYRRASAGLVAPTAVASVLASRAARGGSAQRGLLQRLFFIPVFAWYVLASVRSFVD